MKFVLRLGPREFELPDGRFSIGRAESSGLMLDDPLVSRQHAAVDVTGELATLVDLGSRNGVRVNGRRVDGQRRLAPGDRIAVGSAELLFAWRERDPAAQTLVQAPTQRMSTFGLFGLLADKALALGRVDEAERILVPQLEQFLADIEAGKKYDPASLDRASEYALKLAASTGEARFVAVVFRLYAAAGRLCSSALVDQLYAVARKVRQPSVAELRRYLAVLRALPGDPTAPERFLIGRLDGLERSLG